MKKLSERFGNSADVVIRRLKIGKEELPAAIVYIAGLVDEQLVSQSLLEDLIDIPSVQPEQAVCLIYDKTLAIGGVKEEEKWKSLYAGLVAGSTLIFVDGADKALIASTEGESTGPFKNRALRSLSAARGRDSLNLCKPIFP